MPSNYRNSSVVTITMVATARRAAVWVHGLKLPGRMVAGTTATGLAAGPRVGLILVRLMLVRLILIQLSAGSRIPES